MGGVNLVNLAHDRDKTPEWERVFASCRAKVRVASYGFRMINWEFRNNVLKAVYDLSDQLPGAHQIQGHFGESFGTIEEITTALTWLADQKLLDDLNGRAWGGEVTRVNISPLGRNYVETGTSVEELAKAAVRGSIINAQTNNNYGTATNIQGDHATVTQNINGEDELEKVLAALREANEVEKADELQQEANQNGPLAALKKAGTWIATQALSAQVIAQIAPHVLGALGS